MGFTYVRLELVNADDQALVRRQLLPDSKVRRAKMKALVDGRASSLAINERIQKKLGLPQKIVTDSGSFCDRLVGNSATESSHDDASSKIQPARGLPPARTPAGTRVSEPLGKVSGIEVFDGGDCLF